MKTHKNLIKAISKLLPISQNPLPKEIKHKEEFGIINVDNILMIIGKTDETKKLLNKFIDRYYNTFEKEEFKNKTIIPKLNYINHQANNEPIMSTYNIKLLQKALNLLRIENEEVIIFIKKDYPITLENRLFKIIIAPIVH